MSAPQSSMAPVPAAPSDAGAPDSDAQGPEGQSPNGQSSNSRSPESPNPEDVSPPGEACVEVLVEHPGWDAPGADWTAVANDLHARVLARLDGARPGEIALLLAGDETLHRLNRDFRDRDRPTNVLSFPAPAGTGMLGDVAIAAGVCAAEAEAQDKKFFDHAAHLILHGLLHLHGLDHEAGAEEAEAMEALERAILAEIGIADPYGGGRMERSSLDHV